MVEWLLQNAVVASLLAGIVAIVCRLLRPRPAVCHVLWLLVLVKLLMPPVPLWNVSWMQIHGARDVVGDLHARLPTVKKNPAAETYADGPMVAKVVAENDTVVVQQNARPSLQTGADPVSPDDALPFVDDSSAAAFAPEALEQRGWAEASTERVIDVFWVIWIAGAIAVLLTHAVRIGRLWRMISSSAQAPPSIADVVATQAGKCGLRPPAARICSGVSCPMVVALPRAVLLWPAALDMRLDSAARQAVISHELAHLTRRDHLTAWLEVAATCLWWWHPVVWLARRELREYAELACDAWVVAQCPAGRGVYAKALVDVCEFISQAKIAATPAVGMARGARRSFERRLTMILRQRISSRTPFVAWLAIVGVAVLVLPGFSTGQDDPKESGNDPVKVETKSEPRPPADPKSLKPVVVEVESPVVNESAVFADQPVTANDRLADPRGQDAGAELKPSSRTIDAPPKRAATRESDDDLLQRVGPNRREVRLVRGRGKSVDPKTVDHITEVLLPLVNRMRANDTLRASGQSNTYIVNEVFLHMLDRMPTASESKAWHDHLKEHGDGAIKDMVAALGQSIDFTGSVKSADRQERASTLVRSRSKQPKVQTLLRVVYEIPADKSQALAAFLKENVQQPIDVRVDEESGLIITADAETQAPIAAIVSLMTGERVVLEFGQYGKPTASPYSAYGSPPQYGPPTMEGYLPRTADGSRAGIFPPWPREAEGTKRATAERTKEPPASYDPRPMTREAAKEPPVITPARP